MVLFSIDQICQQAHRLPGQPFQGLDQDIKALVLTYFREKTRGKTVILVTHDEKEAEFFGGPLLLL